MVGLKDTYNSCFILFRDGERLAWLIRHPWNNLDVNSVHAVQVKKKPAWVDEINWVIPDVRVAVERLRVTYTHTAFIWVRAGHPPAEALVLAPPRMVKSVGLVPYINVLITPCFILVDPNMFDSRNRLASQNRKVVYNLYLNQQLFFNLY